MSKEKYPETIEELKEIFIDFGNDEPFQLLRIMGVNRVPSSLKNIFPIDVANSSNGIELTVGLEGVSPSFKKTLSKIKHVRKASPIDKKIINNVDEQYIVSIDSRYIPALLDVILDSSINIDPNIYKSQREVFEWENLSKRTFDMDKVVRRHKGRAMRELDKKDLDPQKKARYERILSSIEEYIKLPTNNKSYPKKKKEKPQVITETEKCELIEKIANILDCDMPCVLSERKKKNPIRVESHGVIEIEGHEFEYSIDVIPIESAITVFDDTLSHHENYPHHIHSKEIDGKDIDQIEDLINSMVVEVMVMPGPYLDGPPVAFGDIILEGSMRVLALRNIPHKEKVKYLDYVTKMTGKRGLLVRKIHGSIEDAKFFLKLIQKEEKYDSIKNPIKNPVSVAVPGLKYKKKGNDQIPVYPTDEEGYPYGAIPIEEAPDYVKRHPTFLPSIKMFKDRYGAEPDYIMPSEGASGLEGVYAGVGEQKQHDYWAAETAKNPYEWIHWYHHAGERGEGVPFTRACVIAADPKTGRIVLLDPPGADAKFTNRGIVG